MIADDTSIGDIGLLEAIYSQRATRHFSTRPVSSDDVTTILKAAVRAPSGGNRQPWRFVVIRDSETKRRLGEWYLSAWMATVEESLRSQEAYRSGEDLGKGMADIPVVILACIDQDLGFGGLSTVTEGASVYPAVQNLLLTARSLGLGTVLTTLHTLHEQEIKDLLGIPERIHTVALTPLGYPAEGEGFGGSRRKPIHEVTYYDRWGTSEETTSQ
jgi:nitroreductase